MTSPITTATSAALDTSSASPSTQPLDRQAFLKLLVAQISHQDPLQPMQGTEFVTQLSQFASVEQAIAQATTLQTLSNQVAGLANNEATSLVGKTVTMRGHAMAFDGVTPTSSAVSLAAPAAKVTADIVDASGNVVRTIDVGARLAGGLTVTWDGKDKNGLTAPQGTYTLQIKATGDDGSPVGVTQNVTGKVVKVSFDKGYPEVTLDTGAQGAIADLVGVQ
jgi:flagellar basal-body rod modification protein FlgD